MTGSVKATMSDTQSRPKGAVLAAEMGPTTEAGSARWLGSRMAREMEPLWRAEASAEGSVAHSVLPWVRDSELARVYEKAPSLAVTD
jgi:hypothetical protein